MFISFIYELFHNAIRYLHITTSFLIALIENLFLQTIKILREKINANVYNN